MSAQAIIEEQRTKIEAQEQEIRRLRKETKELSKELENQAFTVETIQRNLQNVCRLQDADRQELLILRKKEPSSGEVSRLRRELRESEDSRQAILEEVEKLRATNLQLQQKVCRLRETAPASAD